MNNIPGSGCFFRRILILLFAAALFPLAASGGRPEPAGSPPAPAGMKSGPEAGSPRAGSSDGETETAVLAGGCFWGMEGVFERLEGVEDVVSGYSGGEAATAHYNMVGSGTTGHAESVRIVYDPARISYRTLLEVFFTVAHNPTELNYQGPDHGTQYRSAVFYADEEQARIAREVIDRVEAEKLYREPVVTQVTPLSAFYPAEDYHQDFMRINPNHPYIVYWDVPRVKALEKTYPELLRKE